MARRHSGPPLGRDEVASQTCGRQHHGSPASQPLYLNSWAAPTARPSSTARDAPAVPGNAGPAISASTQKSRNETSVSAIRENATCGTRERREGRGHRPGPTAEGTTGEPGDGRNGQRAHDDRDQDRRQVADAEREIRQADEEREPRGCVGDHRRIQAE